MLQSGTDSGETKLQFHARWWGNYDETNDFSWDPDATTWKAADYVTLYYQGRRIWGNVPGGLPPVP